MKRATQSQIRGKDTTLKTFLAGKLRSYRKQASLTQADLVEQIGRTDEAISNIERAKSLPSLETLVAIARTLELPLRDFFPSGSYDNKVPINRLNREAEMTALLRGLTDTQLDLALAQVKALDKLS